LFQIQNPGGGRDFLRDLFQGYVSSIAGGIGVLRHAIVLVWSGDFDDWGLTSRFAEASGGVCEIERRNGDQNDKDG
jgi:hypothetical protein